MDGRETMARVIESTAGLLLRFVDGFDDGAKTAQAPNLPNHVIWTLGHCALTMHKLSSKFDGQPIPSSDFIKGDGTQGDAERFDTESVCFDSVPVSDESAYPKLARGCEVYQSACTRLAEAVRGLDAGALEETLEWHNAPIRADDLIARIGFHNGAHAGQIVDLRRSLNMPRVIQ